MMHRTQMALVTLDLITAVFVATGLIGRFVPPRSIWWLQIFATGLPYLTVLLFALMLLLLFFLSWKLAVFNLIVIVLYASRIVSAGSGYSSGVSANGLDAVTFVSFNAKSAKGARAAETNTMLDAFRPDVVCIQEEPLVFMPESKSIGTVRHLMPLLQRYRSKRPDAVPPDSAIRVSEPVFATLEYLKQTEYRGLPHTDVEGFAFTRSELRVHDQAIAVYNVHLNSYFSNKDSSHNERSWLNPIKWMYRASGYRRDLIRREEEARRLKEIMRSETLPYVLCGDLNSTPDEWIYRFLGSGLQDSYAIRGRGFGATYPSTWPLVRIDYIFLSPEWVPMTSKTIRILSSDHRPVVTTAVLAEK